MPARKKEVPPFERVWKIVRKVPRGRVVTYGMVSQMIDKRLTPVGVGWAIRAASEELPWHRVVNSSGGISTDKEHPGLQRAMLEAEGVKFKPDGTIDLAKYAWQSKPRP
jgi:methylated-DNA-protein-cysteine methyltransferase-like protein